MGYLSRNDLERIATRVFDDYKNLPRFAGQKVDYVDPEILACGLCGLHIDHFHLSQDRLTLGMTSLKEVEVEVYNDSGQPFLYYLDGRTLLIETDLKDDPAQHGRYHFTTAHETAHQILADLHPTDRVIQNRITYSRGHSPQFIPGTFPARYPLLSVLKWKAAAFVGGKFPTATNGMKTE